MSKKERDGTPRTPRPVQRIELSESNTKLRLILVALLITVAAVAFGIFVTSFFGKDPGWQLVQVTSREPNVSGEFAFSYCFGRSGIAASAENKQITSLYTDACIKAYRLFEANEGFDGVCGVHYINSHVNEEITVDPVLYRAFETASQYGSRYIYLAPVYADYDSQIFGTEPSRVTAEDDPYTNSELAGYLAETARYAADPEQISLELLGDNRVRLIVSDEYLRYASENQITRFIDFYRMRNAFIVDYFADVMNENGFTAGYISSLDGYQRNLDGSDTAYSLNILDLDKSYLYNAAKVEYGGPMAIVNLRSFPVGEFDALWFLETENGFVTPHIDIADGLYKSSVSSLYSYSRTKGCAEIMLSVIPIYTSDTLDEAALRALTESQIYSLYCSDATLKYNDKTIDITELYIGEDVKYRLEYVGK